MMKKLLLALCLTAIGVACRTSGASMHDSSCTGEDCGDCTAVQMEACGDCTGASECQPTTECQAATECQGDEAAVCPVTGKSMN